MSFSNGTRPRPPPTHLRLRLGAPGLPQSVLLLGHNPVQLRFVQLLLRRRRLVAQVIVHVVPVGIVEADDRIVRQTRHNLPGGIPQWCSPAAGTHALGRRPRHRCHRLAKVLLAGSGWS